MTRRPIAVVGGGLAGQRCVEALRRAGHGGPIVLVCGEAVPPYDRPPLSKELLAGARDAHDVRLRGDAWYADQDVELLLGTPATGIDPVARRLLLHGGRQLAFGALVIATGAAARRLPELDPYDNVFTLRDLHDALELRARLSGGPQLLVVGGGFVGLEVASTAVRLGAEVSLLEAAPAPLAGVLGIEAGTWLAQLHRRHGVAVHAGTQIRRVLGTDEVRGVELTSGERLAADVVVVAVGAGPDTRWLAAAGLPPDGVPIGPGGTTAVPGVVAAGDVAAARDPASGRLRRSEHWDAAARGGAAAAASLLALPQRLGPPAFFWSDQHGVRLQLVGDPHGAQRTTLDGDPVGDSYALTYWRREERAAVLLVGRPHALATARRLVAESAPDAERRAA